MNPNFGDVYGIILVPIIISDLQGAIKYFNPATEKLNIIFPTEKGSTTELDHLHRKNPSRWSKQKQLVLIDGQTVFKSKIADSSGLISEFEVVVTKTIFGDDPFLITTLKDITREVSLEQKISELEFQFRKILDTIPAIVFVKDLHNNVIVLNETFEEISGLKINDFIGKNLFDALNDTEQAESVWKDDLEIIETGLPKRNIIEPFYWDKNRWFITDKIPLRNQEGKIVGIIGFSIDITERKNVEDALIRSEKKFRRLFDTIPDGIVISDLYGNFKSANKAFLNLLDYHEEEIITLNFNRISNAENNHFELDFIYQSLSTGIESATGEKVYVSKNNRSIPVRVNCWIMKNELGNPIQMGVYVKDISIELLALNLERSLIAKEKSELQQNLQHQTQQLNMKITQLIEKNELVNNVVNQLNRVKPGEPKVEKEIFNIVTELKQSRNDDFWGEFESTFGLINHTFYENLFTAFPNITKNERKLSAFLRMSFSTKDIANITHQSIRSIEMARSRLRQKFNLSRSENIYDFLSKF